jgi:hypothetical protein
MRKVLYMKEISAAYAVREELTAAAPALARELKVQALLARTFDAGATPPLGTS